MMSRASTPESSPGVGEHVVERVAVAAGERLVRVADPDPRVVADVDDRDVAVRVGCRLDRLRLPEVVRDDPLVAVPLGGAEVDVDDLPDVHPVVALGPDRDLLGVEALGPDERVVAGTDHPAAGEQRHQHDGEADHHMVAEPDLAQHAPTLTCPSRP